MQTRLRRLPRRAFALALLLSACDPNEQSSPLLQTRAPLGPAPVDPLAASVVPSCDVYQSERCELGVRQRCDVYDPAAASFVDAPDPLLRRAFLFDRFYDLYHQPDGQTAERFFNASFPPGTPEAQWGAASVFDHFDGVGDAAIWSGVALTSYALRYRQTGTAADYARMERKTRELLTHFDVTGIPGYLARHHFLLMDANAPRTDRHLLRYGASSVGGDDHAADLAAPDLPDAYRLGVRDGDGRVWRGIPYWHGHPSIDQYTGPMTAFPIVFDLMRDPALKKRIAAHMSCYLKRLRRIEIRNLQRNREALSAIQAYFAGGALKLDPGDPDPSKLDTLVLYALPQWNSASAPSFDRGCPAAIETTASRTVDASSPNFLLDMLALGQDLGGGGDAPRAGAYDHAYAPNVRGGDALHLLHLAAMSFHMTGEQQYRRFFEVELLGRQGALGVANTTGALQMPRWCRSYFGDHITFPALWNLLDLLVPSPLRDALAAVMDGEIWKKLLFDGGNLKFDLMYASLPAFIAPSRDVALARALSTLRAMGGNGGILDEPRRSYTIDRGHLVANLPEGNSVRCPTEAERHICEDGFSFLGIAVPGESITRACDGRPAECTLGARCADGVASEPLPPSLRPYDDFLWQRNPYKLGVSFSPDGTIQSPGLDYSEEYWLARVLGFVTEGRGQVLAWRGVGSCE